MLTQLANHKMVIDITVVAITATDDQYPSHELIELEIYNKNVTSNILTSLFGGSESCWGRSNAKASLTKKTNNTN